ncbi:MAG: spermidine synthase [Alphaproteobacteria bacterium]|nr:spermidine synthase [Alphaproteobacteria bacterium]
MLPLFEELDYRETPMGALSLRRRHDLALDRDIYEIKLGEDFLMSSRFTAGEIALADFGMAPLGGREADVVVGGLGLGYTAQAALAHDNVRSLRVIEALPAIIGWHQRGLLPLGPALVADHRCRLVAGDFFAMTAAGDGFDDERPGRRFDAILLDIDHSPRNVLHPAHAAFYQPDGLRRLAGRIAPGGVFALWSNDPPDDAFISRLADVFEEVRARTVKFKSAAIELPASNTVYVALT